MFFFPMLKFLRTVLIRQRWCYFNWHINKWFFCGGNGKVMSTWCDVETALESRHRLWEQMHSIQWWPPFLKPLNYSIMKLSVRDVNELFHSLFTKWPLLSFLHRAKIAWILSFLWHVVAILLVVLLTALLVGLLVLWVCLSNQTMTEVYQRHGFLDYYFQLHMQLRTTGILPKWSWGLELLTREILSLLCFSEYE